MRIKDLIKFVIENQNDISYIETMLQVKYGVSTEEKVGKESEDDINCLKTRMREARAMVSVIEDEYLPVSIVAENKKSTKPQILKAINNFENTIHNQLEAIFSELDV